MRTRARIAMIAALLTAAATFGQAQTPAQTQPPAQTAPPPSAAAPAASPETPAPPENRPPDWAARQYVEIWNTGKFDPKFAFEHIFSPGVIISSHGQMIPLRMDMLDKVVKNWHDAAPDMHFKIMDSFQSGDKVAMRLLFEGTFEKPLFGPMWGDKPHKVFMTEILLFELKDGKITKIWEEYDEARMHGQMGQHYCLNPSAETATKPPAPQKEAVPPKAPAPSAPAPPQ